MGVAFAVGFMVGSLFTAVVALVFYGLGRNSNEASPSETVAGRQAGAKETQGSPPVAA